MNPSAIIEFSAAIFSGLLAFTVLLNRRRTPASWFFFAGMLGLAADSVLMGMVSSATEPDKLFYWFSIESVVRSVLPGLWLGFSLSYSRGNYAEFLLEWRWVLMAVLLLPVVLAAGYQDDLFKNFVMPTADTPGRVGFGVAGTVLNTIFLVTVILIIMNLEKTFRAAVGTMRWHIKFVVLGLGVIIGAKLYVCSQALLYHNSNLSLMSVEAGAVLIGCALIALSYLRTGLTETDVYPSHSLLYGSFTVVLAGIYLVIVGVLARVVVAMGGDTAFPVKALLILVGLVGLAVLLLSDRFRQQTQRLISRHFKRPLYDYRKVWSLLIEKTARATDKHSLSTAAATLISETFNALSVTIWLIDENQKQLILAGSTSLPSTPAPDRGVSASDLERLATALRERPFPFDLEATKEDWAGLIRRHNPGAFTPGWHRICVPIVAGDQALGFMVLSDRVSHLPFSIEEMDLLRCIGNHVAASLLSFELSGKLMQAKEHEAFKAVSAFFAHDLKNAASTLSLMLQNLPLHFEDPAFREDVLRGISKTVSHMNHLINRLSVLRQKPEIRSVSSDLNEVVNGALSRWTAVPEIELDKQLEPLPKVQLDPDQIQNVVTNLVLNAREAIGSRGRIRIQTARQNGWAVLTVSDNGAGMTPEFLRQSLFRPFQTTKKGGTGIGMFQCKMIVEAHHGKIEVESEPGKGTSFHVLLPIDK